MSYFASFVLNLKLSDINAQPKIFQRELITQLNDYPSNFCLDLYLLVIGLKSVTKLMSLMYFLIKDHRRSQRRRNYNW